MPLKLSIIIPCYNCADTVVESVRSCLKQGFSSDEYEIVMVDDCSTDSTWEVLTKLQNEHKEIKIFKHDKNKGGGATRNTAVEKSSGPVIFCLDSDDMLPPNTLDKMLNYLHEKKADGVGIHHSIKFKGTNVDDVEIVHTFGYVDQKIPLESLIQINDVYNPLYSTFMITREAFVKTGGYPEHHGFDTQAMAWRFLSQGLTAYTCPEATYLHRVHFKKSYYLREAAAGKVNFNWQDIFIEHLHLFDEVTKQFILSFNCQDFTRSIYEELKKQERVFRKDYQSVLGTLPAPTKKLPVDRAYVRYNSPRGILFRLRTRIKNNKYFRPFGIYLLALSQRIKKLLTEGNERKAYYERIEEVKRNKKIVVDLAFGGIGDCLAWSTLPRLLHDTYGVEFYLSRQTMEVLRHKDTFKLCFEMNPYFKGISDDSNVFHANSFEREKSLYTFITDKEGKTVIEILEKQFNVAGKGVPEMYYKPNLIPEYEHIILIDENMISGKKFGWKFKPNAFLNEAKKYCEPKDTVEYVDTKKQDFFTYIDMIYSCKRFVGTFSGGASIAACFDKPFSVIWPYNAVDGSNYQYRYSKSRGDYVL